MNLSTLWSTVLLETLIFLQLLKKLTSLRGTQRLISLFTTTCQVVFNLSHVDTIHTFSPIHLKTILSSHLFPGYGLPSWWFVMHSNIIFPFILRFPNGLLFSVFRTEEQLVYFFAQMLARSHVYLILLDSIMVIVNDNYFKSLRFVISSFYFKFRASSNRSLWSSI